MNVVAIVGNGASLPFSPELALKPLVDRLRDDLAEADPELVGTLQKVATQLAADGTAIDADTSFEALLGPLDRMGQVLAALEGAPGIAAPPGVAKALTTIRQHFDGLYRLGLGTVLHHIAALSIAKHDENFERHGEFARWLLGITEGGILRCFTLNYDVLLNAQLLELHSQQLLYVSDQANALEDTKPLQVVPSRSVVDALPLRAPDDEYLGGCPAVVIYHLHGSLQWVRHRDTGDVYKVLHLEDLRSRDFFRAVARGEATFDPVVVLTDRKEQETLREPFLSAYARMEAAITYCDRLVIAGYSFGDVPMTQALRRALRHRIDHLPDIAVIGRSAETPAQFKERMLDHLAFSTTVRSKIAAKLSVSRKGLPRAVTDTLVDWPS